MKGERLMLFDKNDKRQKFTRNKHLVESMVGVWEISDEFDPTDVLGSYRGTPYDADDLTPEQDADDL